MKTKTRTCRYHCSTCDRHFTSLKAFDAHRYHEYGKHPKYGWDGVLATWCDSPSAHGYEVVTADGECRLGPVVLTGASLWGDPDAGAEIALRRSAQGLGAV